MISFPNAKINLGLDVLQKRNDGFHDISSVFYPIPWSDILEIIPAEKLSFKTSGLPIPDSKAGNLCLQAYQLLQEKFDLPAVSIHLHKVIPIGAGLGGGSADGAFALKMLNQLFNLALPQSELQEMASQMGSDCAFFIANKPALAEGRGERLSEIDLPSLKGKYIFMINPGIHISTKEAYSGITPSYPTTACHELIQGEISSWRNKLKNDFEPHLMQQYPLLSQLKEELYGAGALYASMTGSGSTVYGIFNQEIENESWQKLSCYQSIL